MKALVKKFPQKGSWLEDVAEPTVGNNDVKIKIHKTAILAGFSNCPLFVVSMGFLTGTGGGIIRDILVDKTPYVLRKHIYAVASIPGGCSYSFMRLYFPKEVAVLASTAIIILIRVMATKFHWKLPRIPLED